MNHRNIPQLIDRRAAVLPEIRRLPVAVSVAGCVLALATLFVATNASAQDGTWDASWAPRNSDQKGIPGLFEDTWSLGGGGAFAGDMTTTATVVQTDGKMLVAGFGWNTYNGTDQNACIVRRYNADGSVDSGFGNAGAVVTNYHTTGSNPQLDCYAKSLALQPDGKIVYAGQIVFPSGSSTPSAMVARLNTDGSSDASFGDGGFVVSFAIDVNTVLVAGNGDILVAGSWIAPGFTDTDFYLATLDTNGNHVSATAAHWDVPGGDRNEDANAAVIESWSSGTIGNFHSHDEIYLVGVVDNPAFGSGQAHHSCGIAAFVRTDGGTFAADTGFNGNGLLNVDFPVGASDTDTICRTATHRAGIVIVAPTGVLVGGERYYTPNGASLGSASYYALEDISASGAVNRDDNFGFFADLNEAGAFNSINGMVWDDVGKLVTVGYAGIGALGDQTHAPSDGVVRRFNSDYSVDGSFAADHSGTLFASLDDSGVKGILQSQREWTVAIATDPLHGRVVFAGERSIWLALTPNLYAWFLGAVHDGTVQISDRIFANGFD
jgi:uncharacterized delta-60 repeat protein